MLTDTATVLQSLNLAAPFAILRSARSLSAAGVNAVLGLFLLLPTQLAVKGVRGGWSR